MKKILGITVLWLFLIPNLSFAITVETYLKKRETTDIVEKHGLELYVLGIARGIWQANVYENVSVLQKNIEVDKKIFCPPKSWNPDIKDSLSYLDAQISFMKSKDMNYAGNYLPSLMYQYLIRIYPCN